MGKKTKQHADYLSKAAGLPEVDSILITFKNSTSERSVFYLDAGDLTPERSAFYLEQIRDQIKDRSLPRS